ncbi:hypothetical protein BCF11_4233 [Collimonas sp. PA-H2]|uniref:hypothetical protein n=1 Tax=Collimonas sp. PA-H2 TaxID=1881062 RepID=UPI000C010A95|nr:hypothetical protein [Collimonas sp. PA-H2]PFH11775.1 hypothetical protein BCF11_4233 [Collimonas sp. PA-H2]
MSVTATEINKLIESELAGIHDAGVVHHIRTLLVTPQSILRDWDFGGIGEKYPCWSILDHEKSGTGIGHCEFGFGPKTPWGLVGLAGHDHMSLGMDCEWFSTFVEAFFDSMAATELPIWRIFKQEGGAYPGIAITGEADWNSTWEKIGRLRAVDPGGRYHCSHDIQFRL